MRIAVGSDHAGFPLKQQIAEALRREGNEVGPNETPCFCWTTRKGAD